MVVQAIRNYFALLRTLAQTRVWSFWDIVFHSTLNQTIWGLTIFLLGFFHSQLAVLLLIMTFTASVYRGLTDVVRQGAERVVQPIQAIVQDVRAVVPETARTAVNTLRDINGTVAARGMTLKGVFAQLQQHKIGVTSCMASLSKAQGYDSFLEVTKIASFCGIETSLVEEIVGRLSGAALNALPRPPVVETQALQDLLSSANSADIKRLLGIGGLAVTLTGTEGLLGDGVLSGINRANKNAKALEEAFERIEEYLNLLGVLNSGKWAYLKELNERVDGIRAEFEWCNAVIAATPAHFCRPAEFERFRKLKQSVLETDAVLRRNVLPEINRGKLSVSVQAMVTKMETWSQTIAQIRSQNGIRPVPFGVCVVGASQVGKSHLYQELWKRIKLGLKTKYEEDPERFAAFALAHEWQTWNMQTRDEYDQGYGGQEATYVDDGFSDSQHEDHAQWLSFISGEAIGTVQADLQSKGLAYQSRFVLVSCNNLPEKSTKINNIQALHKRFPLTLGVYKKSAMPREYDPEFSHLAFHAGPMDSHCALKQSQCQFLENGTVLPSCSSQPITLDDIVKRCVDEIVERELSFEHRLANMLGTDVQLQMDTISEESDEEYDYDSDDMFEDDNSEYGADDDDVEIPQLVISSSNSEESNSDESDAEVEPEALEESRDIPPEIRPPVENGVPLETVTAAVRTDLSMRFRRMVLAAYQQSPVIAVADHRIRGWAQFLQKKATKMSFNVYVASSQGESAYDFFCSLATWEIQPGKEKDLKEKIAQLAAAPLRIRDERLSTDYLWSPQIDKGRYMFAIPYVEEALEVIDPSTEDGRAIYEFCNIPLEENDVVRAGDEIALYRIVRKWTPITGLGAWNRVIYFGGVFLFSGITRFVATRLTIPSYRRPRPILPYMPPAVNHYGPIQNFVLKTKHYVCEIPAVIAQGFDLARRFMTYAKDLVCCSLLRIADWLGFETSDAMENIADLIATHGVATVATIVVPIVAGVVYALYKGLCWLFSKGQKTESQGYDKTRAIKPIVKARKLVKKTVSQSLWSIVNDIAARPPPGKVNYYMRSDCPFDDMETIEADGPIFDYGEWFAKPNKYPYEGVDYDYVVLSQEHIVENPLYNVDLWVAEQEAAWDCIQDLELDSFAVLERNFGRFSSGSVPHAHIKVIGSKNISSDAGPVIVPKITSVQLRKREEIALLEIGVEYNIEDSSKIWEMLNPLAKEVNLTSWGLDAEVSNTGVRGIVTFLSTTHEGRERILTRRDAKVLTNRARELTGKVIASAKGLSEILLEQQSSDDTALSQIRSLTETHQVAIWRGRGLTEEWTRSALVAFDDKFGPSTAGLATGTMVICPGHIGRVGEHVKVVHIGATPYKQPGKLEKLVANGYMAAKVIYVDEKSDIGLLSLISREVLEKELSEMANAPVRCPHACDRVIGYAKGLEKHICSEERAMINLTRGVSTIQWAPTVGSIINGQSTYTGTSRYIVDGNNVEREWITVKSVSSATCLTQRGDCGGLLLLFNPKEQAKIIGFHVAGNDSIANSALLTAERFASLKAMFESQRDFQMMTMSDLVTDLHRGNTIPAGLGHNQIDVFPLIEWADKDVDTFRSFICEGIPENLPSGQGVRYCGVVKDPVLPAIAHKTGYGREWAKSPFYGAFDIQMLPSPLSARDPRIENELPKNSAGKPSLLATPNNMYGEITPAPDAELCNLIMEQMFRYYRGVFDISRIRYDNMSIEEMLEEALNGHTTNNFVGGVEVNASSGYPWTLVSTTAKKSDLIDVDPVTGVRTFRKSPGGRLLKNLVVTKLEQARKNKRLTSFCTSKLKDTLIKEEHVKRGKTRVFNASAIEDVLFSNAILGRFREAYLNMGMQMHHAIGCDPLSYDWDRFYNYLNQHPNWGDIDYANFDRRLLSVFIRMAEAITIETIGDDGWRTARYVVAETAVNSLMLDIDTVYMTEHSNKSGEVDTTPRNSKVNMIMMFYCWCKLTEQRDLDLFRRNVAFLTFGDDIVFTVSDKYSNVFNFNGIKRVLGELGQVVTPSKKCDGEAPDFVPQEEITFLKRRFFKSEGMILSPLEKRSIEASFGWSKVPASSTSLWQEIVRNDLVEAAQWGKTYYDSFCLALLNKTLERSFPVHLRQALASVLCVSWEAQIQKIKARKSLILQMDNDTALNQIIRSEKSTLYQVLSELDITSVTSRVTQLEAGLQSLGRTLDNAVTIINSTTGQLSQRITVNESAITDLETTLTNVESDISSVAKDIVVVQDDLSDLSTSLNAVSKSVTDLSTSLTTQVEGLQKQIDSLNVGREYYFTASGSTGVIRRYNYSLCYITSSGGAGVADSSGSFYLSRAASSGEITMNLTLSDGSSVKFIYYSGAPVAKVSGADQFSLVLGTISESWYPFPDAGGFVTITNYSPPA